MRNYVRKYFTPNEQRLLYIILLVSFISIIAFNLSSNYLYSKEVNQDSLFTDIKEPYELCVNIKTASKDELMQIKGIGEKTAKSIISFRDTFDLKSNNDLLLIKGIGLKSLAKWLPYLKALENDTLKTKYSSKTRPQNINNKININQAELTDFMKVKGIGVKKANQIKNFIQINNGLKDMKELLEIKGIGKKTLAKIEELFYIGTN